MVVSRTGALTVAVAASGFAGATGLPVIHERQVLVTSPSVAVTAVDIDGDRIALGASTDGSLGADTGAVHVFERTAGDTWLQSARLMDSAAAACKRFGRSVDIEGDTLVTNHWNWLRLCDDGGHYDGKVAALHAFELDAGVWTQTFSSQDFWLPVDLAFDGTSLVAAFDGHEGFALTRAPDGSWNAPQVPLPSIGMPYGDAESHGLHVDLHDGFAAIGGVYQVLVDNQYQDLPAATLFQRNGAGQWQHLADVHVEPGPGRGSVNDSVPRTRVSTGPQRLAINEFVFEPDASGQYVETATLRPACVGESSDVDVEFDVGSELALVRTRPRFRYTPAPSLWYQGSTLHLYQRLAAGQWQPVAQLMSSAGRSPGPAAIDAGRVVGGELIFDATDAPVSYVFSDFDICLGHRGNWVELNPQRWGITYQGGRAYTITTTDYVHQPGDRPGEYSLLSHHRYGDFDFTVKARSNEVMGPYSAADYVVIFGYRDEENYYYMMFSRYAINNELFKVVDGVRQKIARAPQGSFLDNAFHQVDISRRGSQIDILFDGQPYLSVNDATFGEGAIGLGSYNDAVSFDDIDVQAVGAP